MLPKGVFFFGLIILASGPGLSAQQLPFVHYTPKDGLVNSYCKKAFQDSKGRMYFLTREGLSIYDGASFTNFTKADGLFNNLINDVFEAGPDSILIATNTTKINTLVRGKIGEFHTNEGFTPLINTFYKSSEGNFYALADNGFFKIEKNKFIPIPFHDKYGNKIDSTLQSVVEWRNYLLITNWSSWKPQRLILFNKQTMAVDDVFSNMFINTVLESKSNKIWVSNDNGVHYLDTSALKKGKLLLTKGPDTYKSEHQFNVLLHFDGNDKLWLYNNQELILINKNKPQISIRMLKKFQPINIATLFTDREGILWILTHGNGFYKIPNTYLHLINEDNKGNVMNASGLSAHPGKKGAWFFNKTSGTLCYIDVNKTELFSLPLRKAVYDIFVDPSRIILTGTNTIHSIPFSSKKYQSGKSRIIFQDTSIRFLFGKQDTYGNIVIPYFKDEKCYLSVLVKDRLYLNYPVKKGSEDYFIDRMCFDSNNRLWVINRNDELHVFSLQPDKPENYFRLIHSYKNELKFTDFRSLTADKNNNIWIGTRNNGIYIIKFKGLEIQAINHINTINGLSEQFISDLVCDNLNRIWAATPSGLDMIKLKQDGYTIENITRNSNHFQEISRVAADAENTIWATGSQGTLIRILYNADSMAKPDPSLLISSVKAGNVSVDPKEHSQFKYTQNNIHVSIAAPSFIDEHSIKYSYLLEGSGQTNWSEPSINSIFNFNNLAPGHYTLKMKSTFPGNIYDPKMATFSFSIQPPYWQSWWFRMIFVMLACGLTLAAIRLYYNQKLIKQRLVMEKLQAIEKERTRIATDMHDDLGSGLSRIKYLSEMIKLHFKGDLRIIQDIEKISTYSDEMVEKMGEIVWALNEKNDTLPDLLAFTRSYAMDYLNSNGIKCIFALPAEVPGVFVNGETRRNIFLSVKESLHNVVKHANASEVKIETTFGEKIFLTIQDNGKGIDLSHIRNFSNGLSNIKERIKNIGGSVEFTKNQGTLVSITVPLSI